MSRELWLLVLSYAGRALGLAAAGFIVYSVHRRVREGAFELYGTAVRKSDNPGSFWAVILVGLAGACWLVFLALR
jgi:hypothetical protein